MLLHRIPSLNWLRVFEAAARTQSFARAAETLNMSPSAVSQQIRALEGYLGRELFTRSARAVTLTEAGQTFLPVVAQSLHAIEGVSNTLFGTPNREPLSIQVLPLFAAGWLALRLPRFHAREPNVQLSILTGSLQQDFHRSTADLQIVFGHGQAISEDGDPLFGETIYPVAPPDLVAKIETPEDLARHPLIEVATHRANWLTLLPVAVGAPRMTYVDNTVMAFALAASGQGIALARAPASDHLATQWGLVPCLPSLSVLGVQSYSLIYPARSRLGRAAAAFRDWLLEELG